MEIPQTAKEAKAQGYDTKKLTIDEAKKVMGSVATADFAAKTKSEDCSTIPAGSLCWEGNCDAFGWKEVLYCDGTQGCTVYAKVRC